MAKAQERPQKTPLQRVRRKEVRRRILESAGRLFMDHGFQETSLDAVAKDAGFSKGAVYSNFENKDELVFELLASEIDERISEVGTVMSQESQAEHRGRVAGERLSHIVESDPSWQVFFVELWLRCIRKPALRGRFAAKRRLMRARIAELLEVQATSSGHRLPLPAEHLASYVLALSNGLGMERLIDEEAVPLNLMGKLLRWTILGMEAEYGESAVPPAMSE